MEQLRSGDTVFCYVGQKVVAVAVADGDAYDAPKPDGFDVAGDWERTGTRVDVAYADLNHPLKVAEFSNTLVSEMQGRHAPLNRTGTGNQG